MFDIENSRIGIIGLGYVGLPLAVEFGKHLPTLGFDINPQRVAELKQHHDRTLEVSARELEDATQLSYTAQPDDLADCNVFIVTVPTPIDRYKRPDLGPLERASTTVGKVLRPGSIVIYESTVFPGATEEICVPLLEAASGLTFNRDFFAGYSPERINPGDTQHRVSSIVKVTAGSTPEAGDFVDTLYRRIITAGTHKASSIRVAEAAKVIENTQRDVNIALVNDLAMLFCKLGIDTTEVLEAAGTKWNFLPFRPGLVGGHCIGVDPYYLTHKAREVDYFPEVILAGRRINDDMGAHVARQVVKMMTQRGITVAGSRVLIMGLAFKENCPDIRNTRSVDLLKEFRDYHAQVDFYDPWVDVTEAQKEYGVTMVTTLEPGSYDAVIVAVKHRQFMEMEPADIRALGRSNSVLFDVKAALPRELVDARL